MKTTCVFFKYYYQNLKSILQQNIFLIQNLHSKKLKLRGFKTLKSCLTRRKGKRFPHFKRIYLPIYVVKVFEISPTQFYTS